MILWLILLLPLASFALIGLFLLKHPARAAALSAGSAVAGALLAFAAVSQGDTIHTASLAWIQFKHLRINLAPIWDPLAQLMTVVVTFVGALIHIYSLGYMKNDPGRARFFAFMSLFMFSMLGIVLASNFIMLFIFWELVGLSSYLLIGFWYHKPSAAEAGKKALITNKLGDFGFMLGILFVWLTFNTFDFQEIGMSLGILLPHETLGLEGALNAKFEPAFRGLASWTSIGLPCSTLVVLLLFCGVVGKSAQLPLHVWLPDAMEGPTPVSALIHAATMVAAGVYMLCRIFFVISLAPGAMLAIAWVGGLTALFAALWAVAQDDIKRILAFSTMSQLGLMVMSVGLGGPGPAMFHLTTHAFFKALLFLGAGSVLVALHHEQNIWKMGGLQRRMPVTFATFLVGLLALSGFPLLSGFFSKDEILMVAYHQNAALFWVGVIASFLTAFYMARLFTVAFLGGSRDSRAEHARESARVMTFPLCILAVLSVIAGYEFCGIGTWLEGFFHGTAEPSHSAGIAALLTALPFIGLGAGWAIYRRKAADDVLATAMPPVYRALSAKFWFDEFYNGLIRYLQGGFAGVLRRFDDWVIDGLGVRGVSAVTGIAGNILRSLQTGNLQTYLSFFSWGLAAIVFWKISWFILLPLLANLHH
jgi:NADH-quinone oxidoreductase subunit L